MQELLSEVVANWWNYALAVGAGVLAVLVITGADFASAVVYARKNPKRVSARHDAKIAALTFWMVLAALALVPLLWPLYLGLALVTMIAAIFNLFKNLIIWSGKEIGQ